MINVLASGAFDMLHYGHIEFLRRARTFGDRLTVSLATDEANVELKGRHCFYTYEQRRAMLEAVKYVDLVVTEHSLEDKLKLVKSLNINVYVESDQWWDPKTQSGEFDYLKKYCQVVYIPRTPEISTTEVLLHKNLSDLQVK